MQNKIVIIHGSEIKQSFIGRWLFWLAFRKATYLVSVSSYTHKRLMQNYLISRKKCKIINNGFLPPEGGIKISSKGIGPYLITVGSLTNRKGQANVIKALPALTHQFPTIRYTMVGLPNEKESLMKLAIQCTVIDRIFATGVLRESEKWQKLYESDIFLMLSDELPNGDFEGFGIAILEANYAGLPAIGSRDSGIADAIQDGYNGILVDPHNPNEIANAVNIIMADYGGFSKRAKKYVKSFTWDVKILEYLEIINEN